MSPRVKKTTEKAKIPSRYLLLIFSLLCVGLMLLSFFSSGFESFFRTVFGGVIAPFQKGISYAGSVMVEDAKRKDDIKVLKEENALLKAQIDELTNENTLLLEDQYELSSLRDLYELDSTYSSYDKTGARIIAWDNNGFYNSFLIDKGEKDGITVDMNVIAGSGLVGRITETGKNWSRVTTILDSSIKISSTVLHTQDNLIVSGDLKLSQSGYITYSQLADKNNNVNSGDKVVTSYVSDKYLPGILIGYIADVTMDANNLTKSGTLTPATDFHNLTQVLILTQVKEKYENLDLNIDK